MVSARGQTEARGILTAVKRRKRIAFSRLPRVAEALIGREADLDRLNEAWSNHAVNVLTLVAWPGVGKTSLVAHWQADLARRNYDSASYFDWSFYNRGTAEPAALAEEFTEQALVHFGDSALARSATLPEQKGRRLAELIAEDRTLLVLDGLEVIQHPSGEPSAGLVRAPSLAALLRRLAQDNNGLCVVTTRERVADIVHFHGRTVREWVLDNLSRSAGIDLLRQLGVQGSERELGALVKEVMGHALSLALIGTYLARAHHGDVRRRKDFGFEEADSKIRGGHTFRTIATHVKWLSGAGIQGERQLSVLRLVGLFDRPVDSGCIAALLRQPEIPGVTDKLVGISEADWNLAVTSLIESRLLLAQDRPSPTGCRDAALDAHPLIREYFASEIAKQNPDGWRQAHKRLYEHLRDSTQHKEQPTLRDLQPLYEAACHACDASLHADAFELYKKRIVREPDYLPITKLGAFDSELALLKRFFHCRWSQPVDELPDDSKALALNLAGAALRAASRLSEAFEATKAALSSRREQQEWEKASKNASALSEIALLRGRLDEAERFAIETIEHADRSNDARMRVASRTILARTCNYLGDRSRAARLFREAEGLQAGLNPARKVLYSFQAFRYCEFLLDVGQHDEVLRRCPALLACALKRGAKTEIALFKLCKGLAQLVGASKSKSTDHSLSLGCLEEAVDGLSDAGRSDYLPCGHLGRASTRAAAGDMEGSRLDLDEAWLLAERAAMPLFLADIHLHRVRLFCGVRPYPWDQDSAGNPRGPKDDLAAACMISEECRYGRLKHALASLSAVSLPEAQGGHVVQPSRAAVDARITVDVDTRRRESIGSHIQGFKSAWVDAYDGANHIQGERLSLAKIRRLAVSSKAVICEVGENLWFLRPCSDAPVHIAKKGNIFRLIIWLFFRYYGKTFNIKEFRRRMPKDWQGDDSLIRAHISRVKSWFGYFDPSSADRLVPRGGSIQRIEKGVTYCWIRREKQYERSLLLVPEKELDATD